jgi:hypothetical protein
MGSIGDRLLGDALQERIDVLGLQQQTQQVTAVRDLGVVGITHAADHAFRSTTGFIGIHRTTALRTGPRG